MKRLPLLILFIGLGFNAVAQNKDAILGTWLSATKQGHIQMFKRGDKYFGDNDKSTKSDAFADGGSDNSTYDDPNNGTDDGNLTDDFSDVSSDSDSGSDDSGSSDDSSF